MELRVTSSTKIKCRNCGHSINIVPDDWEYSCNMIDDHGENGMGEEYEHDFIIECDCPKCGSLVRVTASCYEYPAGALDYGPIFDASGCDIIEEPVIDIDYSDEIEFIDPGIYGIQEAQSVKNALEDYIANPELLRKISSREFEEVIESVLHQMGFETILTPATRDGGKDIIAKGYIHGIPIVLDVECKQYRPDRKIGIGIVQRMRAVQADDHANKSVIVTTSSFSSDAREYADDHMIALVDMDGIKQWLRDAVQQNK